MDSGRLTTPFLLGVMGTFFWMPTTVDLYYKIFYFNGSRVARGSYQIRGIPTGIAILQVHCTSLVPSDLDLIFILIHLHA